MLTCLRLVTHGPGETQEAGRILGRLARAGDLFLLTGPLGAGKTCLTQGIAWGLGVEGYARSPTFVIAARYKGRLTVHHIDLFRVQDPLEAWDLGLEEYLDDDAVCVVEWADRAASLFPSTALWISLDYGVGEQDRTIAVAHKGGVREDLLGGLEDVFKDWDGSRLRS